MTNFLLGFFIGIALMAACLADSMPGTRAECRAVNPGYDCDLGWVRGDVFK